jgi:hypothetical protein
MIGVHYRVEVEPVDRRAAMLDACARAGYHADMATPAWDDLDAELRGDFVAAAALLIAGGVTYHGPRFDDAVRAAAEVWAACERTCFPLRTVTVGQFPQWADTQEKRATYRQAMAAARECERRAAPCVVTYEPGTGWPLAGGKYLSAWIPSGEGDGTVFTSPGPPGGHPRGHRLGEQYNSSAEYLSEWGDDSPAARELGLMFGPPRPEVVEAADKYLTDTGRISDAPPPPTPEVIR